MKRINLFMMAAIVAVSAMFVSCSTEENDPAEIRVQIGQGQSLSYYNDGATIDTFDEEDVLNVKVTYRSGDANRIRKVFASASLAGSNFECLDTARITGITGDKEVSREFTVGVPASSSQLAITFKALDNKGVIIGNELRVTIKAKPGSAPPKPQGFLTYNKMLGAQAATPGSFFNASGADGGTIMTVSQVPTRQGDVDFAYYYGATNKASIVSPNHTWASAASEMVWGTVKMSSWTTKNATKFFKVAGADGSDPESWWDDNIDKATTATDATQLKAGDVVIFATEREVKGAFVVVSINGENAGTISLKIIHEEEEE